MELNLRKFLAHSETKRFHAVEVIKVQCFTRTPVMRRVLQQRGSNNNEKLRNGKKRHNKKWKIRAKSCYGDDAAGGETLPDETTTTSIDITICNSSDETLQIRPNENFQKQAKK